MMYPELEKTKGRDLLRARRWGRQIIRPALMLMAAPLLVGLVSLIVAPVLMIENNALRVLFNSILLALVGLLLFNSGATRGEKDAQNSVRLMRDMKNGHQPTDGERAVCFHPLKGICTALLGALPWVLLAGALAILSKPYTYTLQDLPSYLGAYRRRWDIGAPLTYYNIVYAIAPVDILRVLVRLGIMPFVYIGGDLSDTLSLLLDRISPLLVLVLPLLYAVGYQLGPHYRLRNYERNQQAKQQHLKKMKRKQKKARAAREPKKEQLI